MPPSPTPPRVSHLMPLPVLAEQLSPSYAKAHNRLPDEVYDEVKSGMLEGRLQQPLLDAIWSSMKRLRPRLDDAAMLERLAKAMSKGASGPRPMPASEGQIEK